MRIAYICQTYPPMISGVSISLHGLATGMQREGHHVLVIAASPVGNYVLEESERYRVVGIPSLNNPMAVNQRFMLWQRKMIAKELDDFSPDLIHIHDPLFAGFWGCRYANKNLIPAVLTIHLKPDAVSIHFPPLPGLRRIVEFASTAYGQWLIEKCKAIIAPSKNVYDLIAQKRSTGLVQISNGIDTSLFSPARAERQEGENWRHKLGIFDDAPIILHVGRTSKEKNIESIIRASEQVMQKIEAHLVIVGDGPGKKDLIGLCTDLGIRDRSHFPGFIDAGQGLPAIYRLASVFVLASEVEAQGLTMLEAAASGLPIVAFDSHATRELVIDGKNGLLIESQEISNLGSELIRLLSDKQLMRNFGKVSRKLAQKHSHDYSLQVHQKLYSSLIADPEPAKKKISHTI